MEEHNVMRRRRRVKSGKLEEGDAQEQNTLSKN